MLRVFGFVRVNSDIRLKVVDLIEKFIIRALIIMMLLAITFGTIELGHVLILEIIDRPLSCWIFQRSLKVLA